MSQIVAWNP